MTLVLAPFAGEPELADPALTGEFAEQLAAMAQETHTPPWCSYIARRDGEPVGLGGFKGEPDEGRAVEIGYLTFAPARGEGVATALAATLIEIARREGAACVLAHTLPEHNPSTLVLAANGFDKTGEFEDPEDGLVWRWELSL